MVTQIWVNIGSGNRLVAWRHQAFTWTNVDLSSVTSCGIHRRALSSVDLKIPISKTRLKHTFLELHQDLPGGSELKTFVQLYIGEILWSLPWLVHHFDSLEEISVNIYVDMPFWVTCMKWYCRNSTYSTSKLNHCGLMTSYVNINRSGLTLIQVVACCLTAPSHCLNQCLLIISEVLWHTPESEFMVSAQATILYNEFENYTFKIAFISPRGQWVNGLMDLLYVQYYITSDYVIMAFTL